MLEEFPNLSSLPLFREAENDIRRTPRFLAKFHLIFLSHELLLFLLLLLLLLRLPLLLFLLLILLILLLILLLLFHLRRLAYVPDAALASRKGCWHPALAGP